LFVNTLEMQQSFCLRELSSRLDRDRKKQKSPVADLTTDLEVAGSVDSTVRVAVRAGRQSRRMARSRGLLLTSQTVARRARRSHAEIVHSCGLLALLLSPESPGDDGQTTDQDCTADTANNTSDDGFRLRSHGATASSAAATFCESGINGGGCNLGSGDDAVACHDSRADCAIFCEV
jgi:hypothetical protein